MARTTGQKDIQGVRDGLLERKAVREKFLNDFNQVSLPPSSTHHPPSSTHHAPPTTNHQPPVTTIHHPTTQPPNHPTTNQHPTDQGTVTAVSEIIAESKEKTTTLEFEYQKTLQTFKLKAEEEVR